ncbi:hypothetical protein H500_07400 [Helicobacter pylori CG-IMSS-2012]|nr:hypothetical protein H500_07400 [Helicobacter pylori CG-IMSS-2012]
MLFKRLSLVFLKAFYYFDRKRCFERFLDLAPKAP